MLSIGFTGTPNHPFSVSAHHSSAYNRDHGDLKFQRAAFSPLKITSQRPLRSITYAPQLPQGMVMIASVSLAARALSKYDGQARIMAESMTGEHILTTRVRAMYSKTYWKKFQDLGPHV